jgi:hypothetical protein
MSLKEFIERLPAAYLPALLPALTVLLQFVNKDPDQAKADQAKAQPKIATGNDPAPSA